MATPSEPEPSPAPDLVRQAADDQVRLLSEVTQDLVWDWDVRTNRVLYNEHFADALGDAPGEYSAAHEWWKSRVHPDDVELIKRLYDEAIIEGRTRVSYEYRILDRAGKYLTLDSRVKFIRDAEGRLIRVLVASRDISRQQQAEQGQRRLTRILEATTDFVCMATLEGEPIFLNAAGRLMIGLGPDEPLPAHLSNFHPEWANEIVLKEARPAAIRHGYWKGETALVHRDGHEVPVSQIILSHPGVDGKIEFTSSIMRDLSDRKREEIEHIEWANRYDAAIRASGQVLFDWNSFTHEITYAGDMEKLLGYTIAEMGGGLAHYRALIHPEDLPIFDAEISRSTTTRDPFHLVYRVRHKSGHYIFLEDKGYFFLDRRGQIGRMVGFFADITAQRHAQDELALAHENLEQRVAKRTAELARASAVIEDRARQQEAVAQLGQRALSGMPFPALAAEAMKIIQSILRVDCTSLLALTIDGSAFVVRAQLGWPDLAAENRIPTGYASQSGYTLLTRDPVIVDDCAVEQRFQISPAVLAAGVRSGVSVLIEGDQEPLGVLTAFTFMARKFVQDDVHFLQAVANVLTAAIQRERAEESVRQAREQAEQASRAKSEFLSRMSHELRTPLNAILGFTQLLELDHPSPSQTESVQHISRAGQHLLSLINEVLDISRIEAGRLALNPEPIDLPDFLSLSLDLIRPAAQRLDIDLILESSTARAPLRVLADRQRLQQVMLNLLSNAVKYNRPGGRVTIACRDDGPRLRIGVTDTGKGIKPEKLDRLFLPFERLGAETTNVEGSGIGLALSHGIVIALGGELNVESRVGEGSTFWVSLPRTDEIPSVAMAGPAPEPTTLQPPIPLPATGAIQLLYIEDEDLNLRLVERILRAHPQYRLITAMQGGHGLDLARAHLPDLILLDINLPDMTGDEVLRRLKVDPLMQKIPVIMVSADAMGDRIEQLIQLGAAGYLTKPYKVSEFLRVIQETLTRR
jgi:PAS domain S-box-containing protein